MQNFWVKTSASDGSQCNRSFTGTFTGDVTVTAGQSCNFVCPGEIIGNVTVKGGTFTLAYTVTGNLTENAGGITLLAAAKVGGNLQISGLSSFAVNPGAAIGGNLQIQQVAKGEAPATVFAAAVKGNLQVQNNNTPIAIGSNNPSSCAGNSVGGDLQASTNTAALSIDYNNPVVGNLQVQNNTGGVDVSANDVDKNLQCQNNTPTPTHANVNHTAQSQNVQPQSTGQCAAVSP